MNPFSRDLKDIITNHTCVFDIDTWSRNLGEDVPWDPMLYRNKNFKENPTKKEQQDLHLHIIGFKMAT